MEKLAYGHRGGNQPVMNLLTHRMEITAQNHGFGLVFPSLGELVPELSGGVSEHPCGSDGTPATGDLRFWVERGVAPVVSNERFGRIRLTHVNLNDGTVRGGTQSIWTVGLNWYLSENLKVQTQYQNGRVALDGPDRLFQAWAVRLAFNL